jgi:choline dehydrogenase-like flavoprotein
VGAFGDGRADVVYDMSDGDLARIKAGLVSAARVLLAGGATEVTAPIRGVGRYRSAQGLAAALDRVAMKDFTFYSAHPQSTCRMGLDPERSVVDPSGRAHRLAGLYIADASIYPTSLGVNPQLTTMAAGTTVARRMLEAG